MNIYKILEGSLLECREDEIAFETGAPNFLIMSRDEFADCGKRFRFPEKTRVEALNSKQSPTVEVYPDLLFITMNRICWHQKKNGWLTAKEWNIFLRKDLIVLVQHNQNTDGLKNVLPKQGVDLHGILFSILENVVDEDRKIIAELERRITDLEDEIITFSGGKNNEEYISEELAKDSRVPGAGEPPRNRSEKLGRKRRIPRKAKVYRNHMEEIIRHRKRILFLKGYIEPLEEVVEELAAYFVEELPKSHEVWLRRIRNQASRNSRNLGNLRDYVTQVREAWQAQVDIGLNDIMRVFTVVTAVFLPLTLIAGWYGMNFANMPELNWRFGYPFAFLLSFITLILSLWYFKKNKFI